MAIKKEELIRNYVKAIREGNAAVFAGSGLSRSSGFVDWKELIRPLAKDIELDVDKETDMLSVAQFYRNKKRLTRIFEFYQGYLYSHTGRLTMIGYLKREFARRTESQM